MLLTAIVFLVILSILVLVHEFGHFIVGKMAGIGVLEFALGLPFTKPLWSKKLKSGMKLSLYPVLFGGFVKLLGEEGPNHEEKREPGVKGIEFYQANVWVRVMVVVAGVVMNLILGVAAFYLFLTLANFRTLVPNLVDFTFSSPTKGAVVVTAVEDGSPAKAVGIKMEDVVVGVNGQNVESLKEFQEFVKAHGGQSITLDLTDLEYSATRELAVVPRVNPPAGQGALGVGIAPAYAISFDTAGQKAVSGVTFSYDMLLYNVRVLSNLVTTSIQKKSVEPVAQNVSGPVGIATAINDILKIGGANTVKALINFLSLLSLSLALMNILPIPAMDGGRLAFLLVEGLFGKKLASKYENMINQAGMVFLLGLIALISYNDIIKTLQK